MFTPTTGIVYKVTAEGAFRRTYLTEGDMLLLTQISVGNDYENERPQWQWYKATFLSTNGQLIHVKFFVMVAFQELFNSWFVKA